MIASPITAIVIAYAYVWKNKGKKKEFKISPNINDLVYRQTIYWIGVFFCPMLFVIGSLSNFILFYVKKWLLFSKFSPPEKIQGIGHKTKLPFFALLFISLFIASIPLILIAQQDELPNCGPYNSSLRDTYYSSISASFFYYLNDVSPPVVQFIIEHLTDSVVLYAILVILGLWLYFTNIFVKKIKSELKEANNYLIVERRDKIELIRQYKVET